MKRTLLTLCLLAALPLFSEVEKYTADQLCGKMESMRNYDWGQGAKQLEDYIYGIYYTGTANAKDAATLEQKAFSELAANQGCLRYKLLLAQTFEICGIQSSAMQLADLIAKNASDPKNMPWIERVISSLGKSSDPKAKDALLKLLDGKNETISNAAATALGFRKEAEQQVAQYAMKAKSDKALLSGAVALGRIGGAKSLQALDALYSKKAKTPYQKQIVADAIFAAFALPNAPKGDAMAKFATKIMADSAAPEGAKLEAYAALVRAEKATAQKDGAYTTVAIEIIKRNPKLAIPSFLELSKLDEPHKVLMVNSLAQRGEGYDKIIALTPQTPELAEAILVAASKMGTDKDFKKLVSFAPLFTDRQYRAMSMYVSAVKGEKKVLKLSELSKTANPQEQAFIAAILDNLDSSSSVDVLLKEVASGDTAAKVSALKALNTAISKCDVVFIEICKMYPTFTDSQVISTAQRLLVNISRMKCDSKMFAAAKAQYDAAKDDKTKVFFMRFAAPNCTAESAEFLVGAYKAGLKTEALREFAKWQDASAFDSLQKIEKADPNNSAEIRDLYIKLLRDTNSIKTNYLQYIVKTAKTDRERNLINMLEMPNFAKCKPVKFANGVIARATHNGDELKRMGDGNKSTRWSTGQSRESGMGLMFEFEKSENLKAVELELANSLGDRVLDPIVFVGDAMDNMVKAEFTHEKAPHSDIIRLKKPTKCKFICIVNMKSQGGHWSAYEVIFDK